MARIARLRDNVTKVYFLNGAWMFLIILPVIVPFYHAHGLNMQQVYTLQAVFAFVSVLFEVPSGYLSDLIGRKNSLVMAGVLNGVAYTIYPFAQGFEHFLVAEFLMGIGSALYSGSDIALIYDTVQAEKAGDLTQDTESTLMGKRLFYSQTGETIAALLGGYLAILSLELPAHLNAITAWIPFFVSLSLVEPPRDRLDHRQHWANIRYIYRSLFQKSRLLTLVILNNVILGSATFLAVWSFQHYWHSVEVEFSQFGYLWAIYNLTVAVTARYAHQFEDRLGRLPLVLFIGLLPLVGFFGAGWVGGAAGILFGFCFQLCRGLNLVILSNEINLQVKSDMRATANSISTMGIRLVFACLGPLFGFLIDEGGVEHAYRSIGVFYSILFIGFTLPLALTWRREQR